jgi:hypothetical protein
VTPVTELSRLVEERLTAATAALAAAAGDATLCSIGRSGRRHPGVKYPEGQVAALRELRRTLSGEPEQPDAVLARVRDSWAKDLARRTAVDPDSDWAVYREGGVDALDALSGGPSG